MSRIHGRQLRTRARVPARKFNRVPTGTCISSEKGADGALPLLIKEKDTKPTARDLQPGLVSDEER